MRRILRRVGNLKERQDERRFELGPAAIAKHLVLRALVEAGFVSRQAGTSRIPDTYRLLALAEVP